MEINIGNIVLEDELNFGNIELDIVKIYPELENLEIIPNKETQIFKSKNYYGYNEVKVDGVTNEIDKNIVPENIKEGVEILGVTGNVEEINTTEISINPSDTEKVVIPEAPYNGFSKVTVGAQSGINPNDYFNRTINSSNYNQFASKYLLKKIPTITVDSSTKSLQNSFTGMEYVEEIIVDGDTSNVTNVGYMYNMGKKLKKVKLIDTSNVTDFTQMHYENRELEELPFYDMSKAEKVNGFCAYCYNIKEVPFYDLSNVKHFGSFCSNTYIKTVPPYNLSKVENFSYAFGLMSELVSMPEFDAQSMNNVYNAFQNNHQKFTDFGGLKNLGMAYLTTSSANYSNYKINYSNCQYLSEQSLINVLTKLYDIASKGCNVQQCVLGSTNLAKLTSEAGQQALIQAQNFGWTIS